jgi:hypothetical protein
MRHYDQFQKIIKVDSFNRTCKYGCKIEKYEGMIYRNIMNVPVEALKKLIIRGRCKTNYYQFYLSKTMQN